jgi:integration host factor subunit alpha
VGQIVSRAPTTDAIAAHDEVTAAHDEVTYRYGITLEIAGGWLEFVCALWLHWPRDLSGEASVTKAEIIDSVYEKVGGFSKKESAEIVETVFDTMKEVLAKGEKIKISGFGNFVVREKKQRIGRNPQTGDPIPISARRVLTFKPSQVLKAVLNPHRVHSPTSSTPQP